MNPTSAAHDEPFEPFDETLLTAYLDDELSNSERVRIEEALSASEDLRRILQDLKRVRDVLQQCRLLELPTFQQPHSGRFVTSRLWETDDQPLSEKSNATLLQDAPKLRPAAPETSIKIPSQERRDWFRPLAALAASLLLIAGVSSLIWGPRADLWNQDIALEPAPGSSRGRSDPELSESDRIGGSIPMSTSSDQMDRPEAQVPETPMLKRSMSSSRDVERLAELPASKQQEAQERVVAPAPMEMRSSASNFSAPRLQDKRSSPEMESHAPKPVDGGVPAEIPTDQLSQSELMRGDPNAAADSKEVALALGAQVGRWSEQSLEGADARNAAEFLRFLNAPNTSAEVQNQPGLRSRAEAVAGASRPNDDGMTGFVPMQFWDVQDNSLAASNQPPASTSDVSVATVPAEIGNAKSIGPIHNFYFFADLSTGVTLSELPSLTASVPDSDQTPSQSSKKESETLFSLKDAPLHSFGRTSALHLIVNDNRWEQVVALLSSKGFPVEDGDELKTNPRDLFYRAVRDESSDNGWRIDALPATGSSEGYIALSQEVLSRFRGTTESHWFLKSVTEAAAENKSAGGIPPLQEGAVGMEKPAFHVITIDVSNPELK